ncbi:hypothetical protein DUNSADRAFT_17257, partial [Dunaliella salina]
MCPSNHDCCSSAELEPSVVPLSSPKMQPLLPSRSKKPFSLSQSSPAPSGTSLTLQLKQQALVPRATLPSCKTATVNMRDPVNMLLDHYHITSALDDHNSALVSWHAQRLERHKAAKGGSSANESPRNSPARGSRKGNLYSNGWDAFHNEPVGTYIISNPEYSFAGSKPLKSERTGGVLYERHTSDDASLPPVQRCYLRAHKRQQLLLQQQQQQERERQDNVGRANQSADASPEAAKRMPDRPLS